MNARPVARCIATILAASAIAWPESALATTLGTRGSAFTVDGKPTFLLGASFYSALGVTKETWKTDLDALQKRGFNWIRVWATWAAFYNDVSAVDEAGNPRERYLTRLKDLVAECDRRKLIVDITLSRGNGKNASPNLQGLESHRQAVETIVTALKSWRNWYLDLSNERNIRDARFAPIGDLRALRDEVKRLDPDRLVTASHGGDISRKELEEYLSQAKLDVVCPHRPRDKTSSDQTDATTRQLLTWMREVGREAPVHFQEPFRRGYADWQPTAEDFAADLKAAKTGGAAGWCFHNGSTRSARDGRPRRSFDLRDGPLMRQLDDEEGSFLRSVRRLDAQGPVSKHISQRDHGRPFRLSRSLNAEADFGSRFTAKNG